VYVPVGMSFHSTLKSFNLEVKVIREGMYTFERLFVERGIAVLFMSEVNPKWMNSLY
jgi:hypothetical protein